MCCMPNKIQDLTDELNKTQEIYEKFINEVKNLPDTDIKNKIIHHRQFGRFENFTFSFLEYFKSLPNQLEELLKNKNIYNYVYDSLKTIQRYIEIENSNTSDYFEKFNNLESMINEIYEIHQQIILNQAAVENANVYINKNLDIKFKEVDEKIRNLTAAHQALTGAKTEEIYSKASRDFLEYARLYDFLFYMLLGGSIAFTTVNLILSPYTDATKVNFIFSKVLTFSVAITLGTLFLRKASHLRKQHDQAHQTSLELQALPLYLENIDVEHHSEIYKNLAEKYFGKELDQTQNDKIGDLMQDQLSAGTELVRASAELVRAKSESGGNEPKSEPNGNQLG